MVLNRHSRASYQAQGFVFAPKRSFQRFIAVIMTMVVAIIAFVASTPILKYNGLNVEENHNSHQLFQIVQSSISPYIALADGTDFDPKGKEGLDYGGCPGNDGKDKNGDNKDNDARQACALKKKKNGGGKDLGDTEWNYNNITGNVTQEEKDDPNSEYNQYGRDNSGEAEGGHIDTSFIDTFYMLIYRTINPFYYLNHDIPDESENDKHKALLWRKDAECSALENKSTYDNDNCDIPGVMTQVAQDLTDMFFPQGVQNGNKTAAQTPFNIGIPTGLLPKDANGRESVPLEGERKAKYTGLEVFGYNLKWTSYNGEWDKISVLPASRLNANINLFNAACAAFWLSITNAAQGMAQGLGEAADGLMHLDLGKICHGICGFLWATVELLTGQGLIYWFINGVINGFEHSLVKKNDWNRNDFYQRTLYNVRILSETDQAGMNEALVGLLQSLNNTNEQDAQAEKGADWVKNVKANSIFHIKDSPSDKKYLKIPANASDEEKNKAYHDAWVKWIDAHKADFEFASKNLGLGSMEDIKNMTSADNSNTADATNDDGDVNGSGASSATGKVTPLDIAYENLVQKWNHNGQAWRDKQINDAAQQHEDNKNWFEKGADFVTFHGMIKDAIKNATAQAIAKYAQAALAHGAAYFFCANDNGEPTKTRLQAHNNTQNDAANLALMGGMVWPGIAAFKITDIDAEKGTSKVTPNSCMKGKMRPPIIGGLNGSAGSPDQRNKHRDTRRMAFKNPSIFDLLGRRDDSDARSLLAWSQKIAMGINFMVNLSFTPLLEQLGIKPLVSDLIDALRETLYLQCLLLFMGIAGVIILAKYAAKTPKMGWKTLGMSFVVGLLGLAFLVSPNWLFKLVDDFPSYAERMLAAVVMNTAVPNRQLCSASEYNGGGKDTAQLAESLGADFDPNGAVRTLECGVWDAYVLEPWAIGQFGTGHAQLYATGQAEDGGKEVDIDGETQTLVGNAPVNLGGGVTMHNWALYQLKWTLSGTSTTSDTNDVLLHTNHNLYRLVDWQAGPDNAKGKDTRFWNWWVGHENRLAIAFMAIITNVAGIMTTAAFAFLKIEATFNSIFLLIAAPFMLLIGTLPGSGRLKCRSWALKLLSLIAKRLVCVLLMCLQVVTMVHVANSGTTNNGIALMVVLTAVAVVFALYRNSLIKAFLSPIETGIQGSQDLKSQVRQELGKSRALNALKGVGRTGAAVAGTVLGGVVSGRYNPMRNSKQNMLDRFNQNNDRKMANARQNELNMMRKSQQMRLQADTQLAQGSISQAEHDNLIAQADNTWLHASDEANMVKAHADRINSGVEANSPLAMYDLYTDNSARESSRLMSDISSRVSTGSRLIGNANARSGADITFRELDNAIKLEKQREIDNAYRNIVYNNPLVAQALLGGNVTESVMRSTLRDVDLRYVAKSLGLDGVNNKRLSVSELESLGFNVTLDNTGNLTSVSAPMDVQGKFIKAAHKAGITGETAHDFKRDTERAGKYYDDMKRKPSLTKPSTDTEVKNATNIADKYDKSGSHVNANDMIKNLISNLAVSGDEIKELHNMMRDNHLANLGGSVNEFKKALNAQANLTLGSDVADVKNADGSIVSGEQKAEFIQNLRVEHNSITPKQIEEAATAARIENAQIIAHLTARVNAHKITAIEGVKSVTVDNSGVHVDYKNFDNAEDLAKIQAKVAELNVDNTIMQAHKDSQEMSGVLGSTFVHTDSSFTIESNIK